LYLLSYLLLTQDPATGKPFPKEQVLPDMMVFIVAGFDTGWVAFPGNAQGGVST
jgi:hypothetical protein